MSLFVSSLIGVGVINIGLVCFLFIQNVRSRINRYFSLTIFGIALWSIGLGFFIQVEAFESAMLAARIYYLAPIVIAYYILLFSHVFPENKKINSEKVIF